VAHHVVGILQAWQVGGVGPAAADHGHTGLTGSQGLLYLLAPFTRVNTRHITKQRLSAKTNSQPVPHTSAGSAGIIAAVADENATAFSSMIGIHDLRQLVNSS
jgi:hypothetical protein